MNIRYAAVVVALCIVATLIVGGPLIGKWAGDAVIHLRVAELFARGHGFQFNLGEPVIATTSLGWTFMLSGLFKGFGPEGTAHAVKVLNVAFLFLTTYVLALTWSRLSGNRWAGLIAAALFIFNPGVFQNSVNGMEAILAALVNSLVFFMAFALPPRVSRPQIILLWLAATIAAITRPEGILFCGLLGAFLTWQRRGISTKAVAVLIGACIGLIANVVVCWTVNGTLVPDSGAARMAAGLRESILIGPIHFHPKSVVRFALYWPIAIGLLIAAAAVIRRPAWGTGGFPEPSPMLKQAIGFALLAIASMLFLYSFVLGATHTIRYWIPFFPLVVGIAATTAVQLLAKERSSRRIRTLAVLSCAMWMIFIYGIELYKRMEQPLGYSHSEVVNAVRNRPTFTAAYLHSLGIEHASLPVKLAVTEVQVRYFLSDDCGIDILSLDGRTASHFRHFLDPKTGMRKFDDYLREVKPDIIELGQCSAEEPLLPQLLQLAKTDTSSEIVLGEFRFMPVDEAHVRYLHDP